MAEKMLDIIYALWFGTPLLFSVFYLLKVLKVAFAAWRKNKNTITFIAKIVIIISTTFIALFLVFDISAMFVFPDVEMPKFLKTLGLVLGLIYICLFSGIAFGLGTLGHGGISPSYVFKELQSMFLKKKDKK